jgi:hypothetical protein
MDHETLSKLKTSLKKFWGSTGVMCIFPQLKNTLQVKENNGLWVKAKTGH